MVFVCSICERSFASKSNLRAHMRLHSGERPYKCHQCTKAFMNSSHLKLHERTHTGERPYKCHQCTKAFISSSNLKIHERTHTGERPYKCHQCTKAFISSSDLKLHERTHTGERPFKCQQCTKAFTHAGNLRCHERTHTSVNNSTSSNNEMKCPFKNSQQQEFPQPNISARNLSTFEGENGYSYQVYQNKLPMNNQITYHREIHQRSHAKERPFKWDKCNKDYSDTHYLKYHQFTHLGFPQPNSPARKLSTMDGVIQNPYQVYHNNFSMNNEMTSHREIHLEDEANHSKQSYSNIQSSTSIHPEQHSFKDGMTNQNIANYPNLSARFNAMDNANFPHQFIPQNILPTISPLLVNAQTQSGKNIPTLNERKDTNPLSFHTENGQNLLMSMSNTGISILDRSIEHPSESVSFPAGNITDNSSISNVTEETQISYDYISKLPLEFDTSFVIRNNHHSIHPQSVTIEKPLPNENTRPRLDNTDMNSQIQNVSLLENTYDQRFTGSSTQNEKRFSFLQMLLED